MHQPSARIRTRFHEVASSTVAVNSEACYRAGQFDHESWQAVADAGVWRLAVPRHFGGADGTWWDFVAAFEGIASGGRDLGFNLSMVAQAGLIRSLLKHGSETQIDRFLPRLMSGAVGATALTETRGGSDVAGTTTTARRDGDGYVLSGTKDHITHGPIADIALVLGRVPEVGSRDITLFLVDTSTPGVRHGEVEDMLGNRTSPTGPLHLDHVQLDRHGVFAGVGRGLEIIYDTISLDRLLYGVAAAAFLEPVLEESMDHAERRTAFKQPIAEHQYVQGRLTDIRFGIETTRWTSYAALEAVLAQRPEASMLCSIAKYQGSEQLVAGTENAIRLLGHLGYMTGPASRRFLDGLGTIIAGGTSEMQRKNVFNQMVALRRAGQAAGERAA
ncbi:acyl-CoA dehydrogenase family protein [Nocardioides plantarum]|uniref:Acyl-CoA dehydrogenase family protein n=1 Tax=Nocardioides plantarum TaxID=29299 RepID=A0ABV5KAS1_9ACTN|nr:acyl-CoA dehydrogenase family protein [Nocardioides plantarum]